MWLNKLVDKNIIETKKRVSEDGEVIETYQKGVVGKSFRIAQNLLNNSWTHTTFEEKADNVNANEFDRFGRLKRRC